MGNATQGVTYINGVATSPANEISYMGDSSLNLGVADNDNLNTTIGDRIMGVDITLGIKDANDPVGFVKDRAPNLPSGYSNLGVPTYGDGKQNTVTTFAEDYSGPNANASFRWHVPHPSGTQEKLFSALA